MPWDVYSCIRGEAGLEIETKWLYSAKHVLRYRRYTVHTRERYHFFFFFFLEITRYACNRLIFRWF